MSLSTSLAMLESFLCRRQMVRAERPGTEMRQHGVVIFSFFLLVQLERESESEPLASQSFTIVRRVSDLSQIEQDSIPPGTGSLPQALDYGSREIILV